MTDPTHAAYVKGRLAAQNGGSEADCPYPDYRQKSGKLTWSRAYRNAWTNGYRDEMQRSKRRRDR